MTDLEESDVEDDGFSTPSAPATETFVIDTNFDPAMEENMKTDFASPDHSFVFEYTERERQYAEDAREPKSLEELKTMVRKSLMSRTGQKSLPVSAARPVG